MADQSTADDVLTVTNITSLSELQASQFLKVSDVPSWLARVLTVPLFQRYGSVQTAVNKFFDHGPELPIESQVILPSTDIIQYGASLTRRDTVGRRGYKLGRGPLSC